MTRRIGDRRGRARFEIVGDLFGSVDVATPLEVRNLGPGGALLDSPLPLGPDSVLWVTVLADGQSHQVQMRVRHSTPTTREGEARYSIGVEFLKLTPAVEALIARYAVTDDGTIPAEA